MSEIIQIQYFFEKSPLETNYYFNIIAGSDDSVKQLLIFMLFVWFAIVIAFNLFGTVIIFY